MSLQPTDILRQLVAVPSVNPMGRGETGPPFLEQRLTGLLESIFRSLDLPVERQAIAPGRENILTRLDGDIPPEQGGTILLLDAHQDTVPVEGMTIDPFTPEVRDGRMYGRGSCDVKGGMAAMIVALSRLAAERPAGRPTIVLACPVNEENGFTGAMGLAEAWGRGDLELLPRAPDAALIAEPTGLNVVVAHRGVIRWRCHALGRASHSAHPEAGENAIYRMGRVLGALEHYADDVVGTLAEHPLVGRATLSVGTIHGGVSVNTVPDRCTIEIDRRLPPGEDPQAARRACLDFLAERAELDFPIEHDPPYMQGQPLSDEDNGPLAERMIACRRASGGPCERIGVAFGTDAGVYSAAGVPSIVFGPGHIEQAHTRDEWIALDQLDQAAEVYHRFGAAWTGASSRPT